jgi:glycosyltransferase involved in cell wall biosynthesis
MRISRLSTKPDKRIFISWVKHTTRSASFAQAFGAECHFIDAGFSLGLLKYFARGWRTLRLIWSRRPAVVICMNPPYFLGLLAWVYCLFHEAQFVLDSHTAAFDSGKWTWMGPLHSFIIRRAVCTTVTNWDLAEQVERQGGRAVVLSDIPYRMPEGSFQVEGDFSVCFVCNYAEDEPVLEVFAAAQELPDVRFYVSGDTKKASPEMLAKRPENVTLTGYLSNEEYAGMLRGVSAMLVLTTRDFTMQRGGSEAITVGKPLITSDWPVLHEIFSQGTVHVKNEAAAIKEGIKEVRQNRERYEQEILAMRGRREENWKRVEHELSELLAWCLAKEYGR